MTPIDRARRAAARARWRYSAARGLPARCKRCDRIDSAPAFAGLCNRCEVLARYYRRKARQA